MGRHERRNHRGLIASSVVWFTVLLPLIAGCAGGEYLMPTPNLYAQGLRDPFTDVPPHLRNNKVEVLYLTDRAETKQSTPAKRRYGSGRSRSVAFGVATMRIGDNVSWDELVKASTTRKRAKKLPLKVTGTKELARFSPTPDLMRKLAPATRPVADPVAQLQDELGPQKEQAKKELADRLARSGVKDVFVFVHGYNNNFDEAVLTIGQLWHFMGRQGVPVAYTWPAGREGLLRGYTYDRESSEFTVYHFKQVLRTIAEVPEVQRVHLIAHSRGTDVAVSAVRELNLEFAAGGRSTREALKLGAVVFAAPDMDFEVMLQRNADHSLLLVPERFALYVCVKDDALAISNWLFRGRSRLGKLRAHMMTRSELEAVRESGTANVIDARIKDAGPHGHSYFYANPAVSSDLILVVRYGQLPGPERPLRADPNGFRYIDDSYPRPAATTASR